MDEGNQDYVLQNQQRWMTLAELASKEQDPQKLAALIEELVRLLDAKSMTGPLTHKNESNESNGC